MKVTCPFCKEPIDVVTGSNHELLPDTATAGHIKPHSVIFKVWSRPHVNGFQTALTIDKQCIGSLASVYVDAAADRRLA